MTVQDLSQMNKKMACVQFIAEVSLVANCRPSDLKLALTIIADLANSESHQDSEEEMFYAAE